MPRRNLFDVETQFRSVTKYTKQLTCMVPSFPTLASVYLPQIRYLAFERHSL